MVLTRKHAGKLWYLQMLVKALGETLCCGEGRWPPRIFFLSCNIAFAYIYVITKHFYKIPEVKCFLDCT